MHESVLISRPCFALIPGALFRIRGCMSPSPLQDNAVVRSASRHGAGRSSSPITVRAAGPHSRKVRHRRHSSLPGGLNLAELTTALAAAGPGQPKLSWDGTGVKVSGVGRGVSFRVASSTGGAGLAAQSPLRRSRGSRSTEDPIELSKLAARNRHRSQATRRSVSEINPADVRGAR